MLSVICLEVYIIFIFQILLLVGLVKLLLTTEKPELCAGIYAVFVFVFSLLLDAGLIASLVGSLISGALAFVYFWLLDRFRDTIWFWVTLVVGLVIGLI